jgi:hypothetical protein
MDRNVKGSLAHMPGAWIKNLASGYSNMNIGDNSRIEIAHDKELKTPSAFRNQMADSMSSTSAAGKKHVATVVHVDGKPVVMVRAGNGYGARPEFGVHGADGEQAKVTDHTPATARDRKYGNYKGRYTDRISLTKGEAGDKVVGAIFNHTGEQFDKDFLKKHTVEVHHVYADEDRQTEKQERKVNKPDMQANYAGATDDEKSNPKLASKRYGYGLDTRIKTSDTPAGNMDDVKKAAAKKFVDKKLGEDDAPVKKAMQLHKELGDLISGGTSAQSRRQISQKMQELQAHLDRHGHGAESEGDDLAKDIGKGGYSREYAMKRLKQLKQQRAQ